VAIGPLLFRVEDPDAVAALPAAAPHAALPAPEAPPAKPSSLPELPIDPHDPDGDLLPIDL
jgi:hypothetical protein